MNKAIPILAALCAAGSAPAQHHGDVWQFGNDAGVRFENCAPIVLLDGQNSGFEGCSAISDPFGQLLFYTNSETVWDRLHDPMPNGLLIPSGGTLSQVIIVPRPQSDSLFYLFTTNIQGSATLTFRYHVVDMSLHGGLGDVSSANNTLSMLNVAEVVSATRHANGIDAWIVCHEYLTDAFLAWQLTPSGLAPAPVISHVGPVYAACMSNINARGELKFSLDGTRLALAGNGVGNDDSTNLLAVFDFDPATGIVSDPIQLPYERGDFGLSFSPDGLKLYGATWKGMNFGVADHNTLYQFDLTSNDSAIIATSKVILHTGAVSEPFGSLQLAPDGRIYVARQNSGYLGVINSPDIAGTACDYVHNGLYLQGRTSNYGLNNYIQYVTCNFSTGQDELTDDPLIIHPVPSDGWITLRGGIDGHEGILAISDASGRVLLQFRSAPGNSHDLSMLPAGCYQVTFTGEQGLVLASGRVLLTDR